MAVTVASCGNMSNNTNENNHQYLDSSGMNADNGNPQNSTAPMRNSYDTDSMTSTSGPDNASPKSNAADSTASINPNSNNGVTNEPARRPNQSGR